MITLATAFNPGDVDPGVTYAKALITAFKLMPREKEIWVCIEYGNGTGANDFVPGKAPVVEIIVRNGITGNHYDQLAGTAYPLSTSELLYDGVGRSMYQYLIDNVPAYAGGTVS